MLVFGLWLSGDAYHHEVKRKMQDKNQKKYHESGFLLVEFIKKRKKNRKLTIRNKNNGEVIISLKV